MSGADPGPRRRFEPPVGDSGEPFWAATRDQRFVLPWCRRCGRAHWYPRERCPHCGGMDIDWREAEGRGLVHAVSVMPKPALPMMAEMVPYTVALVELADGPRMMTNIVADDPWAVAVGDPVVLIWEPLSDGRHLPVFRLEG